MAISSKSNVKCREPSVFLFFFNSLRSFFIFFLIVSENTLQINPKKRPEIDNVLKIFEATATLISNDPKIESDWKSFNSLIKVPAEFKVDERTLTSRDLYKEITQMNLNARSGQMVTGGTKLQDQQDTNFCAYFATMSALRHQLRKIVGSEISGKDTSKIDPKETLAYRRKEQKKEAEKYAGLDIKEYLERRDEDEKRFERDLSVMIGCVSPRSLSARFKISFEIS